MFEGQLDAKDGAFTQLTLHSDLSFHVLHITGYDSESNTKCAHLTGGGKRCSVIRLLNFVIDLLKFLEKILVRE